MREYYLIDGEPVTERTASINVTDAGLLYGQSLFETMLLRRGTLLMLPEHLARMYNSALALGISFPYSIDELLIMCRGSVERLGIAEGVLRVTATAGPGGGGSGKVILTVREGLPYSAEQYEKGFSLLTVSFPRNEKSPLVQHKTGNFLENLLGRKEAQRRGFNEGLFLNSRGLVAEGTVSNIFAIKDGVLMTPPLEAGLLPGTVRELIIRLGDKMLGCHEMNLTLSDLAAASELFITNSLMGVMPVVALDGRPVGNGKPGFLTTNMAERFQQSIA